MISSNPQTVYSPVADCAVADPCPSTQPMELRHRPIPKWKRTIDIVASLAFIAMLSPLFAAIAIYIRLVSGGPVTYCQPRLGEMGKYFTIYKFRTMEPRKDATAQHREYVASLQSSDQALDKPEFEDRLIPSGEFLRSHGLDELPQLFNVLLGSMSLVGPRPEVLQWEDYPIGQRRRFEVKPGITGLWQVSGKNTLSFNEMVQLDLEYIERRSLWLDFKILLRTVRVVIAGE